MNQRSIFTGIGIIVLCFFVGISTFGIITQKGWVNYFRVRQKQIQLPTYIDIDRVLKSVDFNGRKINTTPVVLIYKVNKDSLLVGSSYGIRQITLPGNVVYYFSLISDKAISGNKLVGQLIDNNQIKTGINDDPLRDEGQGIYYRWISKESIDRDTLMNITKSGDILTLGHDPETWQVYYLGLTKRLK